MRSVWLSPGFPAAPAALLESLGAEYVLAPPLTTPPDGSIAVVTGFERDLLARLAQRPAGTSLVVITPPDAPLASNEIIGLRAEAVVPAASIAEVADALKRLPAVAAPPMTTGQDLPWWIRPPQDSAPHADPSPASPAEGNAAFASQPLQDDSPPFTRPPHDTAVLATTPLPAFGQPVGPPGAGPTETLAIGDGEPARRRFALTGRQARIVSIAAVVIAMATTGIVVGLDSPSSSQTNAAATTPGGSNNLAPFGNSNGGNGFGGQSGQSGQSGSGSGQGNGTAPQFGAPDPMGGQSGQSSRREELQQFLACLKQNGVSIDNSNRRLFDPTDPQLRTALNKCASLMPFGRFGRRFGGSSSGTGSPGAGNSHNTGTSNNTGTSTSGSHST